MTKQERFEKQRWHNRKQAILDACWPVVLLGLAIFAPFVLKKAVQELKNK